MPLGLFADPSPINRQLKPVKAVTDRTGLLNLKTEILTQPKPDTQRPIPTLKRSVVHGNSLNRLRPTRTAH